MWADVVDIKNLGTFSDLYNYVLSLRLSKQEICMSIGMTFYWQYLGEIAILNPP